MAENKKQSITPAVLPNGGISINGYKHLKSLVRHINIVQDAGQLLGERLIDQNECEFGKILIANTLSHDQSKFFGIEWDSLRRGEEPETLILALKQHLSTNKHHPEYWGGIDEIPRIFLSEMVCDWYARSTEMGTDIRKWVKEEAVEKYKMSLKGKTYKSIKYFLDMLLDDTFEKVKT